MSTPEKKVKTVFVSYSHDDEKYLEELSVYLRLLEMCHGHKVEIWSDQILEAGDNWKKDLFGTLNKSDVAVLLISQNFMTSGFINDEELPIILAKEEKGELVILGVILRPIPLEWSPLKEFQLFNRPHKPMSSQTRAKRDFIWLQVCERIKELVEERSEKQTITPESTNPSVNKEKIQLSVASNSPNKLEEELKSLDEESRLILEKEIDNLVSSIKGNYSDMSDEEAQEHACRVLEFITEGIEQGDQIVYWQKLENGKEVITPLDADKNKQEKSSGD